MNSHSIRNLMQFRNDVKWQYEQLGAFTVSANQKYKVRSNGQLEPFAGDTVIFDLPGDALRVMEKIQNAMYKRFPDLFCTRLSAKHFHITLHDLIAAPLSHCGENDKKENIEYISRQIRAHQPQVEKCLAQFRKEYPNPIRIRFTSITSMVNCSVVAMLEPEGEEDCRALMSMYQRLQSVVPLPYSLTPHITLAYYKPHLNADGYPVSHTGDTSSKLTAAFREVFRMYQSELPGFDLEANKLSYRCFYDMDSYCTPEELLARFHFSEQFQKRQNMIFIEHSVSAYEVIWRMAAYDLPIKTAEAKRRCRRAFENMVMAENFERPVCCTGSKNGPVVFKWLGAAIVMNMYWRGMLSDIVKACGEENLIRHCLYDLGWIWQA